MSDAAMSGCTSQTSSLTHSLAYHTQLEAARGKEMQSHGELVGRLERQAESRSAHQSDLQMALAKLTTDRVRLEAEQQAIRAKWLQECEQHDSAKAIITRVRTTLR